MAEAEERRVVVATPQQAVTIRVREPLVHAASAEVDVDFDGDAVTITVRRLENDPTIKVVLV